MNYADMIESVLDDFRTKCRSSDKSASSAIKTTKHLTFIKSILEYEIDRQMQLLLYRHYDAKTNHYNADGIINDLQNRHLTSLNEMRQHE